MNDEQSEVPKIVEREKQLINVKKGEGYWERKKEGGKRKKRKSGERGGGECYVYYVERKYFY